MNSKQSQSIAMNNEVLNELSDVKYALDQSSIVAITDERGKILYANELFCKISKYEKEELIGQDHRVLNSGYHPRSFFKKMWSVITSGNIWKGEIRNKAKDGSYYWVDTTIVPLLNEKGNPYQYVSIRNDISQRKKMEEELRESEEKYRLITENSSDMISIIDQECNILYASPSHAVLLGHEPVYFESSHLLQWVHEGDRDDVLEHVRHIAAEKQSVQMEFRIRKKNDSYINVEATINPIFDTDDRLKSLVMVMRDITKRKESQDTIYHLAYHDTLTDLPNRRLFLERLRKEVLRARRLKTQFAILFLDLDRFKYINDSLGHEAGDLILIQAANRIRDCVRSNDMVARLGGDEFIVLLSDVAGAEEVASIANRIQAGIREPVEFGGQHHFISCSAGIALFPEDGKDGDELMKRADMALYAVKDLGRNGVSFYKPDMEERSLERILLENELKKAVEKEQFHIDYQPKVNLATGKLIGMEALVRWNHPELGKIPPNKFIPIAEETGLIVPLGEWVLRQGCLQNKAWQDQGYPPLKLSVNLSAVQFYQVNLLEKIQSILDETGLEPQWLEIEVTESILAEMEQAAAILQQIKDIGIETSIDDFGTGYSSFSYIKHLPVNTLKIDTSFIRDLHENKESQAIVKAILSLAETLQLNVIAEGVENTKQLDVLNKEGCEQGQGFLFSKPLSTKDFEKYLDVDISNSKH